MKERLAAFCLITSLIFTPVLYAQTTPPVLTLTQQAFIKEICLALLSDPSTPGEFLAPGLTADRWCDARVVDAFLVANWTDLLVKHNALTLVATDNQTRIVSLEAATTVDVVALETQVVALATAVATLENQVAALEAALASVKTALGTP